jgi:hypothetical protein
MDAKITLAFDRDIIEAAKKFAADQNISLSRLMEHLLRQITAGTYNSLEDLPISTWVNQVAEGKAEYHTRAKSRKELTSDFFENR